MNRKMIINAKKILQFVVVLFAIHINGQQVELMEGFWSDFEGKLGEDTITMTLYPDKNNQIQGNYCNESKNLHKIVLSGAVIDTFIVLETLDVNNQIITFHGQLKEAYQEKEYLGTFYSGTVTNNTTGNTQPFRLAHNRSSGGTLEHRYMDLFATNDEVDAFVGKMKTAILQKNKKWLAQHLNYPIEASVSKGNIKNIVDERMFIANFDVIFPEAFLLRAKTYPTCNLWVQSNGAAFGNGEIWIHNKNGSRPEAYYLAIKEIHAYF